MKKILFISPTGTLDNGAEISITNLMVLLSKKGYDIYNVIPKNSHQTKGNYYQKMESNNISLFSIEFKKWWWEDAPGHMHSKIEERALYYQKYIYDIRKIIVDHSIDLVISSTVNVFQGALAAACEEVEHYWLIHEFPLGEFSYYQKLIPLIESLSSKLFAVQGSLTEYLKPYLENPQKISSFIPFSDITRGDQLKNINKSRIVSIGRINDNKNQLELLRAYSSLSQPLPELLFIGDWDESYKRKCDHYIKENKLSQASFIGHQSDPWKFLSNKDILVLNSKMETFGLVFVEALIKGIPVIAANNFGYQSVTDYFQFGHLYPSGDTEKLSQELTKLINYYPEYKTKAMNQRDKVMRQYTIEKAYHSIIEVIENDTTISPQKHTWLKPFLGAYNPQKIFSPADKDSITIYYCSSNEVWNEENTLVFPLKDSQVLYFEVPDFMTKLRIDMSEVPSYYDSIKLINVENGTQILPIRNTGFNFEDSYYFNHVDPQLEFNISYMGKKSFQLSYKVANLENLYQNDFLPNVLSQKITDLEVSQNDLDLLKLEKEKLSSKNEEMQKQLDEMVLKYNSVIYSRRWTIPTKIIDFLRRKK